MLMSSLTLADTTTQSFSLLLAGTLAVCMSSADVIAFNKIAANNYRITITLYHYTLFLDWKL